MFKLSFVQKNKLENGLGILLVTGSTPGGQSVYAYIRMERAKIDKLSRDIELRQEVDPKDYGEIIVSGEGSPDEVTRQMMEEKYNFDHRNQS